MIIFIKYSNIFLIHYILSLSYQLLMLFYFIIFQCHVKQNHNFHIKISIIEEDMPSNPLSISLLLLQNHIKYQFMFLLYT